MKNTHIWLVGAGEMAYAYTKVLLALDTDFTIIGRGEESAKKLGFKIGKQVISGGLTNFLKNNPPIPSAAIVAVQVDFLKNITLELIKYGIRNILVEKPGGLNHTEINELTKTSHDANAEVFIAYNRRFYASVIKIQELINKEKILSFNFEFTEWGHIIKDLRINQKVKDNWFLANSSHVVDLAFYLGGGPVKIDYHVSGGLDWHQKSSVFSGTGISETRALFSYHANWESAGRWRVEILTNKQKFILCPLEELKVQNVGSINVKTVPIDDFLDKKFKPGLYRQVESFLSGDKSKLCSVSEQARNVLVYNKIAGYD